MTDSNTHSLVLGSGWDTLGFEGAYAWFMSFIVSQKGLIRWQGRTSSIKVMSVHFQLQDCIPGRNGRRYNNVEREWQPLFLLCSLLFVIQYNFYSKCLAALDSSEDFDSTSQQIMNTRDIYIIDCINVYF